MPVRLPRFAAAAILAIPLVALSSCGGSSDPVGGQNDSQTAAASLGGNASASTPAADATSGDTRAANRPARKLAPLKLGPGSGGSSDTESGSSPHAQLDSVLEAMQPVQVVLGQWRGITQKAIGGMKAVEQQRWVWDFQSDPQQPSLVMASDSGPYFRSGRLTFRTDLREFEWSGSGEDGVERIFRGNFTEPPRDVPGEDPTGRLERTFKLTLTEVDAPEADAGNELPRWQLVFNQQENNRYLIEFYRERTGGNWFRFDTVASQREGTSIAANDADYGTRTCVVSQGLGTISVTHAGKTFWVCCTGCKAAFEDDPQKWIARAEAAAKESP